MVIISTSPPVLSSNAVSLYYTRDALLENLPVLIFYGPSTTGNTTHNSSRIQAHIYSLAGFQTFPRLTISPSSPLYAAVYHLPTEQQGDQICRGLAVSLLSYFAGVSDSTKASIKELAARRRPNRIAPMMFDEMHAGELASKMIKAEEADSTMAYITSALARQSISWIDMDIVLPPDTIQRNMTTGIEQVPSCGDDGLPLYNYGALDSLISSVGVSSFLPTSKMRRAPSKPTAYSKHKSLLKDQKVSLRREMCELVDTEQRYVEKLDDLLNSMAQEFRHIVPGAQNPNPQIVDRLFPHSLSAILQLNQKFYQAIQNVLQSTENEAIKDIEDTIDSLPGHAMAGGRNHDLTGTVVFAKELVKWFPEFMSPYQDFMRASVSFPDIINEGLQDDTTKFTSLVYEIGEQQLRSSLIEPVQRLPRYSLFIDNIVGLLPAFHPAVSSLLKARDMIADICALDNGSFTDNSRTVGYLKNVVKNWPAQLSPSGRLINAVDISQLKAPYHFSSGCLSGILLLFPEALVVLEKTENSTISARGLMTELDRPAVLGMMSQSWTPGMENGLIYQCAMDIFSLQIAESEDGQLIWVNYNNYLTTKAVKESLHKSLAETRVFSLHGMYERKATRFSEEVIKAKMEGRFSETVRESQKWALRTLSSPLDKLSILAAIWEDGALDKAERNPDLSSIRVLMDSHESIRDVLAKNERLDIVATIERLGSGGYRLAVQGAAGNGSSDDITGQDCIAVLVRRVSSIIQSQSQKLQSRTSFHRSILQNVPLHKEENESRPRNFRPISPVKMISSFLGGVSSKQRSDVPIMKAIPLIPPPMSTSRNAENLQSMIEKQPSSKVTMVGADTVNRKDILNLLEETLTTYLTALRSRSGNVVGKVLRSRAMADELLINELYNILIEDPSRVQAAAEASVDILFAAFEKFLKRAWREHMGPLLTSVAINNMQFGLDSGKPGEFTRVFAQSLEDLTPQNKRAFTAIIKLLSDLLDASGNDGDRGILIASFTEALVLDGNPNDYINLLDRLADDYDNLFDGAPAFAAEEGQTTGSASSSLKGKYSLNTGSLSSNASSLRKKFGFGTLSRENSKSESESKVASVWRTLSKTSKTIGDSHLQSSSVSKASLVRSRSTDTDTRMLPPLRPVSRDRPLPLNEESQSRPGSSHLNMSILSTIGEGTPTKYQPLAKKKRRSSLSDLKVVHDSSIKPSWSPLQPSTPDYRQPQGQARTLPRTPSPRKPVFDQDPIKSSPQGSGSPGRFGSPHRFGSPQRHEPSQRHGLPENSGSPHRKENSPLISRSVPPKKIQDFSSIKTTPKKQTNSQSGIPTPKVGLSERAWPPNSSTPPRKLPQPSQKLRMQSPQKLRERLSNEQKAISAAESSLKAELAQIGEELSVFKLPRSPTKPLPPSIDSLSTSLSTLSTHVSTTLASLTSRTSTLSADLDSSLVVADKKARALDQLYREANAENEALYERFNEELGRILKGVRAGNGVEELRGKMVEAQGEVGRLRAENKRLKREVVGLKSLVRDG